METVVESQSIYWNGNKGVVVGQGRYVGRLVRASEEKYPNGIHYSSEILMEGGWQSLAFEKDSSIEAVKEAASEWINLANHPRAISLANG